jgi:cysteine synthase A
VAGDPRRDRATSGNTGIGLAMVCAAKGYPFVALMAESFSVERRKLMRFLGAKVVLTPAPLGATGMIDKTKELAAANGWFMARQFENETLALNLGKRRQLLLRAG